MTISIEEKTEKEIRPIGNLNAWIGQLRVTAVKFGDSKFGESAVSDDELLY